MRQQRYTRDLTSTRVIRVCMRDVISNQRTVSFEGNHKRDGGKICGRKQKGLRLDYADLRW